MSKLETVIIFDASELIKFYNKGIEDAFVSLCEFHDLETTLNERGIDGEAQG